MNKAVPLGSDFFHDSSTRGRGGVRPAYGFRSSRGGTNRPLLPLPPDCCFPPRPLLPPAFVTDRVKEIETHVRKRTGYHVKLAS